MFVYDSCLLKLLLNVYGTEALQSNYGNIWGGYKASRDCSMLRYNA